MPEWAQGFIRTIEPVAQKDSIEKGDKLKVTLEGASFSPVVLVCLAMVSILMLLCSQLITNHICRKTLPSSSSGEAASPVFYMAIMLSVSTLGQHPAPPYSHTLKSSPEYLHSP